MKTVPYSEIPNETGNPLITLDQVRKVVKACNATELELGLHISCGGFDSCIFIDGVYLYKNFIVFAGQSYMPKGALTKSTQKIVRLSELPRLAGAKRLDWRKDLAAARVRAIRVKQEVLNVIQGDLRCDLQVLIALKVGASDVGLHALFACDRVGQVCYTSLGSEDTGTVQLFDGESAQVSMWADDEVKFDW